jgi:hypothetical protein
MTVAIAPELGCAGIGWLIRRYDPSVRADVWKTVWMGSSYPASAVLLAVTAYWCMSVESCGRDVALGNDGWMGSKNLGVECTARVAHSR